jgi:hypothetical protein
MKACPYWDQIRYIAADPDIANLKETNMTTGAATSVRQHFEQLGVHKFVMGYRDEGAWLSAMQRHWGGAEVTFKILTCCPMMIAEFQDATYINMTDRQLETQNFKEQLVDRHNHSLDDCKYFINSSPSVRSRRIVMPNLIENFSSWKAPRDPYDQFRPTYGGLR